ncbi:MAG: Amuc_1101 family PilM-like pilus complex protein [Verrucomicrobiota bacterium]
MAAEKFVAMDLGAQQVSAAVFSKGPNDQLILEQFQTSELLADPAADSTRLDQSKLAVGELVKELKLKKMPVRYSVSSQSVFTRFVKLPPLELDQIDQIVLFEARQQVPFPLEEAVWDYQALGDPDDIEVEVVLTAIKSDELDQLNNTVRSAGMDTEVVDLAPMALYNSFRYNYPDVGGSVVLIDIGARTTNLIYCEGPKVFVRNINVGGRDITNAIAKEFDISFQEAEERKIQDGFVALGGGYADHEDPEIAAMSKVIRQASARLHSEIVRTNNFYRSNQGGSAPLMAFLCGSGSGLPYLNEFLQEKLKINVDYFNALRNVQVGKKVDEAVVSRSAHSLGELIGLGLRGFDNCPMELNLVPRIVKREKDIEQRGPAIWLAGITAAVAIGAAGFFFQNAVGFAEDAREGLRFDIEGPSAGQPDEHPKTGEPSRHLQHFTDEIDDRLERLQIAEQSSEPYTEAVHGRIYWVVTFSELAKVMTDDRVLFTEIQPLVGGKTLIDPIRRPEDAVNSLGSAEQMQESAAEGRHIIDGIQLRGLYRENESNEDVVYKYAEKLYESEFFDLAERDEEGNILRDANGMAEKKVQIGTMIPDLDIGSGTRHAMTFRMVIPLPENRKIPYTK